jgi:Cysteine dioxygenase type I
VRGRFARLGGLSRGVQPLGFEALETIAVHLSRTAPEDGHSWTEGDRRRYARMTSTDLYDAWLIAWSPSSGLDLHDHGGSRGVIALRSGTLLETYTDEPAARMIRGRMLVPADVIAIPTTRVHEVSNPSRWDATSIHVYSPPLLSMSFFGIGHDGRLEALSRSEGDLAELEEATGPRFDSARSAETGLLAM